MFVSHDKNINKKKFQKPNILRRKGKIPAVKFEITAGSCESPESKSLITPVYVNETKVCDIQEEKILKRKICKPVQKVKNLMLKTTDYFSPYEIQVCNVNDIKVEVTAKNNFRNREANTIIDHHEATEDQNILNVESFLVSETDGENITFLENDIFQTKTNDVCFKQEQQENQKWCFELNSDFTNNSQNLVLEQCEESQIGGVYIEQKSDIISTMVPLSAVQHNGSYILPMEQTSDKQTVEKMSVDQFFARCHKFKCDAPDCDKEFMSEQKLKKHKNIHNKNSTSRASRQTVTECPVKKIHEDGTEEPCGMIFQIREHLIKHLNEDHKPEDASYRCEECGRRFFWASGLRGHTRAHGARRRAALACAWPGCGRVFRQPCRLREHTRAHTGDRPYPCRYPNCGWSFRSASKLVRHARRHTGERRHACAACGRAFLRREHLRDHAARHHHHTDRDGDRDTDRDRDPDADRKRRPLVCTYDGCERTFSTMNSLQSHKKRVHRKNEEFSVDDSSVPVDTQALLKTDSENMFMVTYMSEAPATQINVKSEGVELALRASSAPVASEVMDEDEGGGEVGEAGEAGEVEAVEAVGESRCSEQSARTHCTWPLPRVNSFTHSDAYVLEEDGQVEHSEISESNIYTVRSDLFLHGNVLTNEDSEQMARSAGAGALDAELLLAPSVDIAQEELYTDAVDESAFRVFLLSGEELT